MKLYINKFSVDGEEMYSFEEDKTKDTVGEAEMYNDDITVNLLLGGTIIIVKEQIEDLKRQAE